MTTIAVVKKNGIVAIAADTLITFGNTKESAEYVVNHQKIVSYKNNFLAVSGSSSVQIALEDYLIKSKKAVKFGTITEIYRFGLLFHKELKDNHFLRPDDDDDDFETFRGDIVIANPFGIFGLSSYRYVQEYSKFYTSGSGSEFASGAIFAIYNDAAKTAEDIAKLGVTAGAEFDDGTGLPVNCYTVKLKK
jgi:ATP-dependent HslUV protease, peptidase subunit HslV